MLETVGGYASPNPPSSLSQFYTFYEKKTMRYYLSVLFAVILAMPTLCFSQDIKSSMEDSISSATQSVTVDRMKALQNDDEVSLFFVRRYHRGSTERIHRDVYFTPKLVAWSDGRVLYGRCEQKAERDSFSAPEIWKYSFAKVDPSEVKKYVNKIQSSFRFGEHNGAIVVSGRDSNDWMLNGITDSKTYSIITNTNINATPVKHDPKKEVGPLVDMIGDRYKTKSTNDWIPLKMSEFDDAWRKIGSDVCEWGETAVKKDSMAVRVDVNKSRMTVRDENGNILVQCVLPP